MKSLSSRSEIILRVGLGFVFLYSGIGLIRNPLEWVWAIEILPAPLRNVVEGFGAETFLRVQGVIEILFAIGFLSWFLKPRIVTIVSGLASLEMLSIILFVGINQTTFRDIGLLAAAAALFANYGDERRIEQNTS